MRRVLKKFVKKFLVSKAVDFKSSLLYNGFYIKEFIMSEPTRGAIMSEIEHLAKMIETLTDKVNSLDDRMDRVDSMVSSVEDNVSNVSAQVDSIDSTLCSVGSTVDNIDARIE